MPSHRRPAAVLAQIFIIMFALGAIAQPALVTSVIMFALLTLFFMSPWADRLENRER